MFLGTYFHTVDSRNRVSIPKKFRQEIGEKLIITRGLDGCLFLYSQNTWQKIEASILQTQLTKKDARSFARLILSGAMELSLDKLGRVVLPDYLKNFANIEKEVAILGVGERMEIWDKRKWQQYTKEMEEKSDQIAERLSESSS